MPARLLADPVFICQGDLCVKIVIIGATGTIGKAVVAALGDRHQIVEVGKTRGALRVDMTDPNSIGVLFKTIGKFDALVVAAGKVHIGDFEKMTEKEMYVGIRDKLMGQVNAVLTARDHINDGGSFTLTSGTLSHDPIRFGVSASMVNGAIDAFVRAASIELPRGLRINSVSCGLLEESAAAMGEYFRGHELVSAARVARAYVKSVEGRLNGQTFLVV
jgi:NAD(P)-dependent dehydrogenase (short-subunit alcohol dehydrogenase family)